MPQEAVPTAKEEIGSLGRFAAEPALDFSRAPKHVDPNDPFNIYRPERKGIGKQELVVGAVVLAVVLVTGVGAWYKNLLPFSASCAEGKCCGEYNRHRESCRPGQRNEWRVERGDNYERWQCAARGSEHDSKLAQRRPQ